MKLQAILLLGALGSGCATNPATGIAATNNPLLVKDESGTGTYVSNDVVAESTYTDSSGNQSTYQRRADREHSYTWNYWHYFQGREELDEQDYYRLAGDQASADKIDAIRHTAALEQKIALPIFVAGLIATAAFSYGLVSKDPDVRTWGVVGSSAVAGISGLVWYWGYKTMRNPHQLSKSHAIANADVVQTCWERECTTERGGHVRPPAPRTAQADEAAAPTPRAEPAMTESIVGQWTGNLTIAAGTRSERRTSTRFEIAKTEGDTIAWIPDAAKRDCVFEGRLDGKRAELVAGKTCHQITGPVEQVTKILPGSSVELASGGLTVHVELEITLHDLAKRHRKPPVTSTVTVDAVAHRDR